MASSARHVLSSTTPLRAQASGKALLHMPATDDEEGPAEMQVRNTAQTGRYARKPHLIHPYASHANMTKPTF
eukprot:1588411-Pleurochrysis_carterae.AAC.1